MEVRRARSPVASYEFGLLPLLLMLNVVLIGITVAAFYARETNQYFAWWAGKRL